MGGAFIACLSKIGLSVSLRYSFVNVSLVHNGWVLGAFIPESIYHSLSKRESDVFLSIFGEMRIIILVFASMGGCCFGCWV